MSRLLTKLRGSQLQRVLPALVVRGGGLGLQIGMSIVIARLLGADGMGLYTLYVTWLALFADLISMGLPVYGMRTVASLKARGEGGVAGAFVRRALGAVVLLGLPMMLLPWFFAEQLAHWVAGDAALAPAFQVAAAGALVYAGMRLLAESLKAAGATQRGLIAESFTIPLVVLVFAPALLVAGRLDQVSILWLHLSAVALAFGLALGLWAWVAHRLGPAQGAPPAVLTHALPPLWGGTLINMLYVSLPILVLPHFATVEELGQFGVAFRLINLVTVILVTLAAIFGPEFAAAYALRDPDRLRLLLRRSQQFSLLLFAPFLIVFTLFGSLVLGLFGEEFRQASLILAIMALGQLVNAATGLVGYLLNMMHHERTEFVILLVTLILMLAGMILGGRLGAVLGVTLAYSGGLMLKNLLSFFFSQRALRRLDAAKAA